jgi:hypothetical protein
MSSKIGRNTIKKNYSFQCLNLYKPKLIFNVNQNFIVSREDTAIVKNHLHGIKNV